MPGRTDGPGADPDARARPDARGRAPGSQDELRRRLADLPVSHPSSPRYRGGQPDAPSGRAGREGGPPEPAAAGPDERWAGRSGEPGADGLSASRGARSEQSRVNRAGQPAGDRDEPAAEAAGGRRGEPGDRDDAGQDGRAPGPREAAGGAAAVAARLIRGRPRAPEQEAKDRRADDALWARAAAQHAAAQARRRARGTAAPSYPSARREPFRPWFTSSAEDELWLNAERTGDPWFTDGDDSERER